MLDDLIKERLKKLAEIKKAGVDPYPAVARKTHTAAEAHADFAHLSEEGKEVALAGRLASMRDQGNIVFLDLADESGKIQIVLKKDSSERFDFWKSVLDIGDFVSASGTLFKTKKGEESLEVKTLEMLAKSLRPLPSKWYGLEDVETRLRKRYLDLLLSPDAREMFRKKAIFWQTIRNFMIKQRFLEVWTPVLENIPGGADAEPFVTHHNALDRDFYLRISLELPLKRLLVGGYDKVFEIGRLFRNEGIDREHLQEYDDMEFYWAYADYKDGMKLAEKLFKLVVKNVAGSMETEHEGQRINWDEKWPKVDYFKAFKEKAGLDLNKVDIEELRNKALALGIIVDGNLSKGRLIDAIYKKTVRSKLVQPCFLIGHPVEISPLAKVDPRNPRKVLRFQILAAKSELGNGWSEVNDPQYQLMRFEEQMKLREAGDKEAQMLDKDYVEALEYGMPPAVGFGVSERLFSVLMNKSVRETVIFPPMKEE